MMRHQSANTMTPTLITICFIVPLLASLAGRADSPAEIEVAAKAKFKEGIDHFGKELYPQALAAFEASYQLRESPIVLYNIGMCQKALFQYPESMNTFHALLAMKKLDASIRQGVETAIEEMAALSGSLNLVDAPEGASVAIDGKFADTTPLKDLIHVAPGHHTAVISKPGHETLEMPFTANQGEVATVRAALQRMVATLKVDCPEGATLHLNGVQTGSCPFEGEIQPGTVEVRVTADGKKTAVETVNLTAGATAGLTLDLEDVETPSSETQPPQRAVTDNGERSAPVFLITGLTATVLGVSGLGVGVAYTALWFKHRNDVDEIIVNANDAHRMGDRDLYNMYVADYNEALQELEEDIHPKDRAGMIAGFVTGGVLTIAGATLLVVHTRKKKRESKIAVFPVLGGLAVQF